MPRHHQKRGPRHSPSKQPETELPESITTDPKLIHLDGRTLEGGGQLVRIALSLSALTGIPIHIHHIRGGRSANASGRGGGLKSSHLAALNFLSEATAAKTHGAFVGSSEILFEPGRDRHAIKARGGALNTSPIFTNDRPYEIKLSSPGSIWLILQCILPWILLAAPSTDPVRLTLHGGTNVSKSMSGECFSQVLLPTLRNIGLPEISLEVEKRGWSSGTTTSIGLVHVSVPPLPRGTLLQPFTLDTRGPISDLTLTVLADPTELREALIAHAQAILNEHPTLPGPKISINESSGDQKRIYLLLVATSATTGHRLGRDSLFDGKLRVPLNDAQIDVVATKMARRVVGDLVHEIEHGGGADEFMEDQMVVFEALAGRKEGEERVSRGEEREESLHTKTCRWVVEQILGREDGGVEGVTDGIGLAAGEVFEDRTRTDDLSTELKRVEVQSDEGRVYPGEDPKGLIL